MDERELYKPSASCSHYDSDNQLRLHYRYATDLPEMQTLIGNCMEHAIVHLAGKSDMDPREFLPEPADVAAVKQQMKSACALRNKKNLVKHRMVQEYGWKLSMMSAIDQSRKMQIANDECDFGMGLELGHWLFLANHQLLDKVAYRVLSTAYTLLGRVEYKKVLDAQMAPGIRRRSEVDMRKENTVS
ncbi:hypothetical protein ANCCEY_05599 [Ancylostoma ceylanicum]|uniref:Uncharacterized protein n=1 Tax=Ancylostoma ceylanicum TaxID=53326 RepID=A0A0D6LTZ1_9BILA|nr:hypothetical protein ANCCEY_05599 [Ancylostoma ceylanicum]